MAAPTLDYAHLLSEKHPSVIHNEEEHKYWLAELETIFQKEELSDAERRYSELLSVLIEEFEKKAYPLAAQAGPIDVLKELMLANGLQQKDLLDVFKHKTVVSEVLSGKRDLTVDHIRGLADRFHVSPQVFI
jgi:HTH-type transcriptional regulator / antitoxin HigA